MDYFDSFDCQVQCEESYYDFHDCYGHDYCYTGGSYFESPRTYPSMDDEFEALFDEI